MKDLKPEDWTEELNEAIRYQRDYGFRDKWPELEALYLNAYNPNAQGPNLIASSGDTLLSSLTVPFPKAVVRSSEGDFVAARVVEAVDNGLLDSMKVRREVEGMVLDAYLYGVGIMKIGFDSEFGWSPRFQVADGMTMTQFDQKGRRLEYRGSRSGMPWIRRILPHDFLVPRGTRDVDTARWVAHRIVRHVDEFKKDPKYVNTSSLQPMMSLEDYERSYEKALPEYRLGDSVQRAEHRRVEFVEAWEIHDTRTGKIFVVAPGHKKFLRSDPDLLSLDEGLPFVSLSFVRSPRSFWTTPDAFFLRQSQSESTDISLQASKQRRVGVLKLLVRKGVMTESQKEQLLSPDVGAVVEIEEGFELKDVIQAIQPGSNFNLYADEEHVRRNAREVIGFSRNQLGEFESTGRRTAFEARTVQQGADKRSDRRALAVRDVYVDVLRKTNEIVFEYWRSPRLVEVIGEEGLAQWVRFKGSQLKGSYRYEVQLVSEPLMGQADRRQMILQLYSGLVQNPFVDPLQLTKLMSSSLGDPELAGVFRTDGTQNANVRVPMQQVSEGGGGSQINERPQ